MLSLINDEGAKFIPPTLHKRPRTLEQRIEATLAHRSRELRLVHLPWCGVFRDVHGVDALAEGRHKQVHGDHGFSGPRPAEDSGELTSR